MRRGHKQNVKLTVKDDTLANVTISSWWLLIITVTACVRQRTKAGRLATFASILESACYVRLNKNNLHLRTCSFIFCFHVLLLHFNYKIVTLFSICFLLGNTFLYFCFLYK